MRTPQIIGAVLCALGIALSVVAYVMRPIGGLGDAFSRAMANPNAMALTPMAFKGLIILVAVILFFGICLLLREPKSLFQNSR